MTVGRDVTEQVETYKFIWGLGLELHADASILLYFPKQLMWAGEIYFAFKGDTLMSCDEGHEMGRGKELGP